MRFICHLKVVKKSHNERFAVKSLTKKRSCDKHYCFVVICKIDKFTFKSDVHLDVSELIISEFYKCIKR